MKKVVIIISCFLFILISVVVVNQSKDVPVNTNKTNGYALINNNNTYFYKYTIDNPTINNKFFLLEKTYYVKVIEDVNDDFYKAEYQNVIGYVKKNEIEFVEEIPKNPFPLSITFDTYSGSSIELRTEASTKNGIGSIITTLPKNTKNINYIGKLTGEESIKGLGNIWYYCSYQLPNNKEIFGYVYSPLTVNLSPIVENNEQLTVVTISNYIPIESLLYLNLSTKSLIIICISLPVLLIMYLFTKPTKILKK